MQRREKNSILPQFKPSFLERCGGWGGVGGTLRLLLCLPVVGNAWKTSDERRPGGFTVVVGLGVSEVLTLRLQA